MKPAEGVAMGDRYRLVSRIAIGGMGEVWVAHDESLARDVAVKVLREEFAGDEGFLERFRTEARNSAQLSHPNIAQLYDYGEQDGSGFLVMELILGEPLADLLDREPVLPTRRLLPILAETARALHAAHVAGVVHRDVKPGNILLARSGRVKITDFGISTATGRIPMTDSGMVMGTAQYLSPEQAIGRAATPASDIYALGIVAYEALVGNRPFTGPTAVDIAVAHVNLPVPPLPADVDPTLAALVMRMLAKDPEERPRSAASLARVLDDMAERTPSGGIPSVLGRHARLADVVDAVESGAVDSAIGTFPGLGGVPPLPPEDDPGTLLRASAPRTGETRTGPTPTGKTPTSTTPVGETRTGETPAADDAIAVPLTPTWLPAPTTPPRGTPSPRPSILSGPVPPTPAPTPASASPGTGGTPTASRPTTGGASLGGTSPGDTSIGGTAVASSAAASPSPASPTTGGTTPARPAPAAASSPSTAPAGPAAPAAAGSPAARTATAAMPTTPGAQQPGGAHPYGTHPDGTHPDTTPASGVGARMLAGLRDATRDVGHWLGFVANGVTRPLPAGTTTGRRWGKVSWPLVVLILMILFALLGAAFADRLWGPSRAAPALHDAGSDIVTAACSDVECWRGIIGPDSGMQFTTTARNH